MPLPTLATGFDPAEPPTLNGRRLRKGDPVQHYRTADGVYRFGSYVGPFHNDPSGETVLVDFGDDPFWQAPLPVSLRNLERPL